MHYVIKATIKDIYPPIWRRLKVGGSLTFAQLHRVLQAAFGWLDYHMYRFGFDGVEVIEDDPDFPGELAVEGGRQLYPAETTVSSLFETQRQRVYEYDFGGSWEHEIVVESRVHEGQGPPAPLGLAGARHWRPALRPRVLLPRRDQRPAAARARGYARSRGGSGPTPGSASERCS